MGMAMGGRSRVGESIVSLNVRSTLLYHVCDVARAGLIVPFAHRHIWAAGGFAGNFGARAATLLQAGTRPGPCPFAGQMDWKASR